MSRKKQEEPLSASCLRDAASDHFSAISKHHVHRLPSGRTQHSNLQFHILNVSLRLIMQCAFPLKQHLKRI